MLFNVIKRKILINKKNFNNINIILFELLNYSKTLFTLWLRIYIRLLKKDMTYEYARCSLYMYLP